MIRLAGMMKYDISDSDDGMCVSIWFQGCPHHCKGCHNPETWNFKGGKVITEYEFYSKLLASLKEVKEKTGSVNLSLLGGEPLCPENIECVHDILINWLSIGDFRDIKVTCWTGYYLETELKKRAKKDRKLREVLNRIDVLIDGRFDITKKDTTLKLRGSSNQTIWVKKKAFFGRKRFVKEEGN